MTTELERYDDNPYEMTAQERLDALLRHVGDSMESLLHAAAIFAAMETAGDDISGIPHGLRLALRRINARTMLPEVHMHLFGLLQKRVAMMPLAEQRKIVEGQPVDFLILHDGGESILRKDPRRLSPREVKQLFTADGEIRDVDRQRSYIQTQKLKAKHDRRKQSANEGSIRVKKRPKQVDILDANGQVVRTMSPDDLWRCLAELGETDA